MSTDDLLVAYAATGAIRYHKVLKAYFDNGELLPVYEAKQYNDLAMAEKPRLVIRLDGLVVPATQTEVA